MPETIAGRHLESPRFPLLVPLLTAANVLIWVAVSLQLAHSLV